MSGKRWKGSQPTEEDVSRALAAFETDLGLVARVVIKAGSGPETLIIDVQSYRETLGVTMGISRYVSNWHPSGRSGYGAILLAIHHVYQDSYEKAHSENYPHKVKRSK